MQGLDDVSEGRVNCPIRRPTRGWNQSRTRLKPHRSVFLNGGISVSTISGHSGLH